MELIEITIEEDGSFSVEAKGYKDKMCLHDLKKLEEVLGHAEEIRLKPEGRNETSTREGIKQG